MSAARLSDGTLLVVYNPNPDGGRTPLVYRLSSDDGRSFSDEQIIEADPTRGYCYTAIFETRDGAVLLAYCRGKQAQGLLNELGIIKMERK